MAVSLAIHSMFWYGTARLGSATLYGCRSWYVDSVVIYVHPAIAAGSSGESCQPTLDSGEETVVTSLVRATAVITNYEDCSGRIEIYDDDYIYYSGQIALKRGVNVIAVEYYIEDMICAYTNVQEFTGKKVDLC